jgi:hypothetical protein
VYSEVHGTWLAAETERDAGRWILFCTAVHAYIGVTVIEQGTYTRICDGCYN